MAKKIPVPGGGVQAAADLLNHLDSQHSERLLKKIKSQDSEIANQLEEHMVVFEDLQLLTTSMIKELLSCISLDKLGLALRLASPQLRNHFLKNVSQGMKREIEDVLVGPPQAAEKVQQAHQEIMKTVRTLISQGKIVLKDDEWV